MQATQDVLLADQTAGADRTPWPKVVLWAALFQFAWFWQRLPNLFLEGAMPDTDDYQRLASVRAFLDGQGWFDLTNYRMDPPAGADMHWSRLVDLPVAGLVSFFDLFTDALIAERLTAVVWPLLLLIATAFVIIAICRRLEPSANPLLALFFTVTCITALTEFMPGRLDHHSVQILGFCLMLLGLIAARERWGGWLVGAAAAFSLSVGLDAVLMVVFMLAWLGIDWAFGRDRHGAALRRAAGGLATATPLLYAVNVAPADWFKAHCDANSSVYLVATMTIAAAFLLLASLSPRLQSADLRRMIALRLAAGAFVAALAAGLLLASFPQCAGGPYGAISAELGERWLVNVSEARGLPVQLGEFPQLWLWGVGYSIVLLVVGGIVVWRRSRNEPAFIAVYATFVISVLASFIQYRAMRIGVFASIPLIVVFIGMAWTAIGARLGERRILSGIAQALCVALLAAPVWLGLSAIVIPDDGTTGPAAVTDDASSPAGGAIADWKQDRPDLLCNRRSQYAKLADLPAGLVMSDINSGPVIVVHTGQSVVGGPYHRNERAILDMVDFFETDVDTARSIAERRAVDYVAYCEPVEAIEPGLETHPALAIRIRRSDEPVWLKRLSDADDRLHLFRVELD